MNFNINHINLPIMKCAAHCGWSHLASPLHKLSVGAHQLFPPRPHLAVREISSTSTNKISSLKRRNEQCCSCVQTHTHTHTKCFISIYLSLFPSYFYFSSISHLFHISSPAPVFQPICPSITSDGSCFITGRLLPAV